MSDVDIEKEEAVYKAISIARELNIMAADFPEKEFDIYRLLREHLPISCIGRAGSGLGEEGGGSGWFFAREEDVAYVFRHPELFSNDIGFRWIPQGIDPPEHTEYRKILNPLFSQESLTPIEPRIQEFANQLLDKMLEKNEFEYMWEFAEPFPTIIFCELMGFPLEDYPKFMRWKDIFIHGMTAGKVEELGLDVFDDQGRLQPEKVREAQVAAGTELYAYFNGLIEERRRNPTDDLTTKLVQGVYAGERPLTDDELLRTLHLLMLGGLDTVTSTLGLIMVYFTEHPEKRREFIELMDDPSRANPAIEELVRYTAIVSPARKVTQDCSYRGLQLRKGDTVMISTPSANRDESVFPNPDEVIYDRHPNPHSGFALGLHRCLGMHLARRELKIGLQEFHRRVPDYSLQPGKKAIVYGGGVKGVTSLPLVVGNGS